MSTLSILSPPRKPPLVATGFEDDDVRDLGDRIAALEPDEAAEFAAYLRKLGVESINGRK